MKFNPLRTLFFLRRQKVVELGQTGVEAIESTAEAKCS